MHLKDSQVTGLNTDQKASLAISNIRDSDKCFLAVMELKCDDAFTKGRQILSDLSDFYFDFEGNTQEKLAAAFAEAGKKLSGDSFSLGLAGISGKVLYLIGLGEVQMYLKRGSELSQLLSVGSSGQIISGFLSEGDRLLLSTTGLIDFLGADLLKSLQVPVEEFEEEITGRIEAENSTGEALAGVSVEIEHEVSEDFIPSISKEEPVSQESYLPSRNYTAVFLGLAKKIVDLRKYFPGSNRGRLIVAILLILIIVLGVGYKYKLSKDTQINDQFVKNLQTAQDSFNAAKDLSTLNPKEAKDRLDLAKSEIDKALILKPTNTQALDLKKQIETDSSSILQQVSLSDFPLFLDMDLVKKNFRATQMSYSAGKLLLFDPAVKTLVVIDVDKKSNKILAGEEQLGEAMGVSLNGGLAFIHSKDKGLLKIDVTNSKLTVVSKPDNKLGEIKDIYGFASNIYLLDGSKNMIWKFLPIADGYSDAREYLTPETKLDLSSSIRMQIESSVYILKSGGEIIRLTKGAKDNFGLEGLDKGVKDPKGFFVSSETENLYVLDSGNSRMLILTKTGQYKGSMSGDKFGAASDLVVDELAKKVYLLDGSKIYTVDLK